MKKVFTILLLLMLAGAVTLAAFIATFNADQYRPLIVRQLQSLLGKSVQLERIGLAWEQGLALELKKLVVYETDKPLGDTLLSLDSASAVLELWPLLNRQLSVGAVIFKHPNIRLVRGVDGRLRGFESMGRRPASPPGAPALSLLLIRRIQVEDGVIRYRDESAREPMELTARHIDIAVHDMRLNAPIPFKITTALFGDEKNLEIRGDVRIDLAEKVVTLEKIHVKSDIGLLRSVLSSDRTEDSRVLGAIRSEDRSAELMNAMSGLGAGAKVDDIGGNLEINIGVLKLSHDWLKDLQMEVLLNQGWIKLAGFRNPAQEINAKALIGKNQAELQNFSGRFAGGTLSASGILRNLSAPQPASWFKLNIAGLDLGEMIAAESPSVQSELRTFVPLKPTASRAESPEAPSFQGVLSLDFEGYAAGLKPPVFSQTLAGQGQVRIQDGVLRNRNFVREVFEKLSLLPGVVKTLEQRLPPSYQERFQARDTVFAPIWIPFGIKNGFLVSEQFAVTSDTFDLSGRGQMNLTGILGAQAVLRLDTEMSQAFIRSIEELQYLADRQKRLEIPLTLQGPVSDLRIFPSLQVIASRLALSKTQELIGDWLGKKNKTAAAPAANPESAAESSTSQKPKSPTAQDILSLFLGAPQSDQDTTTQSGSNSNP